MQRFDSICPEKQGLILVFSYRCKNCQALFAEMRSAIMEARAIVQDARAQSRASNRSSEKWCQITERWESARPRWVGHQRTSKITLRYTGSTPRLAKSVAQG
jgi:hypothetical protein